MTIKLQDLYGSVRGIGNPTVNFTATQDDDDTLLAYVKQRLATDQLNLEVLLAHKDDLRAYEGRRITWLRTDITDCHKAIAMLTGDFN
jgi:hypothetical protein